MVRRFCVMSSPVSPSPRVAPCTNDAVLVARADRQPVELRARRNSGSTSCSGSRSRMRRSKSRTSSSLNALSSDSIGNAMPTSPNAATGAAPTRCVGESAVRSSGYSRFDGAQLQHQPIVFGVRHLRIVERVIAVVVTIQQLAQFRRAAAARAIARRGACAQPDLCCRAAAALESGPHPRAAPRRAAARTACPWRPAPFPANLSRETLARSRAAHRRSAAARAARATPRTCSRRETPRSAIRARIESARLDQARDAKHAAPVGVLAVIDLVAAVGEPVASSAAIKSRPAPARVADRADTQRDDFLQLARIGRRGLGRCEAVAALRAGCRMEWRLARCRGPLRGAGLIAARG